MASKVTTVEQKTIVPYIGITDFMNFDQVKKMQAVFSEHVRKGSKRKLHVGVMMSYKTLCNLPTKYKDAFPQKETIKEIFGSQDVYNCLHYADYDDNSTDSLILDALYYTGEHIHALQLDMIWPDPDLIKNVIETFDKKIEIILQLGGLAFNQVNNDLNRILKRLSFYDGIIDRVLLDKSMGKGVPMNSTEFIPMIDSISEKFPSLGIVVAGGLGPNSRNLVEPIIDRYPYISTDAQSKLRPSGSALDPIDLSMCSEYIKKYLELLH